MTEHTQTTTPRLEVRPARAQVDERVTITLNDLCPHQPITLQAYTQDEHNIQWCSTATYRADEYGQVNISSHAALAGTYTGIEPMGLYWSMYPQVPQAQQALYTQTTLQPMETQVTLEIADQVITKVIHQRCLLAPEVHRTVINEQGIIGTFFRPSSPGPHPSVILLSGSSGLQREPEAALLAAHGYCTLAPVYFGQDPLPLELQEVPLEYLHNIILWLQALPEVQAQHIAVMGTSKGGEMALLAATLFPEIAAVICQAPSAVMHQGLGTPTDGDERARSSWTYQGKQLPFLPYRPSASYIKYINKQRNSGKPVACLTGYMESLQNRTALGKATIPVEKIHAPLLLISGQKDEMWPSTLFGNMIEQRLRSYNHPYPYQHLCYEDAGHKIGYPYIPTTVTWGRGYAYGGSPSGNAYANEHSWLAVLSFLNTQL